MLCPNCGHPDAYVGFSSAECVNVECAHFSQPWLSEVHRSQTRLSEPQRHIPDLNTLGGSFREFDTLIRIRNRLLRVSPHGYFIYCNLLIDATRGFTDDKIRFWSRFMDSNGDWIDEWITPDGSRVCVNLTKVKSEYEMP